MLIRNWRSRVSVLAVGGLAGLAALFVGMSASPASAATAPHIKVSIVHNNAGTMKVTGTNFTKNSVAVVNFDQNAGSGDLAQSFNVRVTSSGKFTLTAKVFISAVCRVGVAARDEGGSDSNFVTVKTKGKGCKGGAITVDPCAIVCGDFGVKGTGFTPTGTVDVEFRDGTTGAFLFSGQATVCGTLAPGPYPHAPAGQLGSPTFGGCNGIAFASAHATCGRASITVTATEIDTDYIAPPVTVSPRC
jgi:hypothetical protein